MLFYGFSPRWLTDPGLWLLQWTDDYNLTNERTRCWIVDAGRTTSFSIHDLAFDPRRALLNRFIHLPPSPPSSYIKSRWCKWDAAREFPLETGSLRFLILLPHTLCQWETRKGNRWAPPMIVRPPMFTSLVPATALLGLDGQLY